MKHYTSVGVAETEIVLLCCRSSVTEKNLGKIRSIVDFQTIDWEQLLVLASKHRIFPLLYTHLKQIPIHVPGYVLDDLRTLYKITAIHNLFYSQTLLKLLDHFSQHEIKALPFKGPVLAESVYGSYALRSYGDLDILVSAAQLRQAVEVLCRLGYLPKNNLSFERQLRLCRYGKDGAFIHPKTKVVVELHHEIGGFLREKWTLETLQPFFCASELLHHKLLDLQPEMMLIYLCVHGSRHHWYQLDFVCVVAETVRNRPGLDFQKALMLAEQFGCRKMLLLGLCLSQHLLNLSLPKDICRLLDQEEGLLQFVKQVETRLLETKHSQTGPLGYGKAVIFYFKVFDHAIDAGYCIADKLFSPDGYDLAWLPLPQRMWFLYKILRPLRLAYRFVFYKKIKHEK
ncbi:nucleotidyltransferase domain-containing protein [Desulfogranum mediterraneum]|uniref:nucleotidyltransferase domain-containing protein n=1 Tax=Desulfogranum mediterraneum TaxID=160661 RepID=UPI0004120D7D|nr:nucleotidyltransferase family protein [Desulfogranum mediterraneum]